MRKSKQWITNRAKQISIQFISYNLSSGIVGKYEFLTDGEVSVEKRLI